MIFSRSQKSFSLHWNKIYISEEMFKKSNKYYMYQYIYICEKSSIHVYIYIHPLSLPFPRKRTFLKLNIYLLCWWNIICDRSLPDLKHLTIHDGMVVDFIKEQLVKCWHFSSVHECSSLTMYYFTASCYLRCLIPLPAT